MRRFSNSFTTCIAAIFLVFATQRQEVSGKPTSVASSRPHVDSLPSDNNACNAYAASGLDFTTQIKAPCMCNRIVSVDLPCGNCRRGDCTGVQEAVFILDVTCANSDTTQVQAAWQQMHYDLPDAFSKKTSSTTIRVLHEITLQDISASEQTSWNDLLNTTTLMPLPSKVSQSAIEAITFAGSTLDDGTRGKNLSLHLGPAFSAMESFRIINASWLKQLPANFLTAAPLDSLLTDCIGGILNIVIDQTSLVDIDPQAFASLLPVFDGPMFTITNSRLAEVPFAAMRLFNQTYQMDFSNNIITSVNLNASSSVPYCLGDVILANNQIGQIADDAFWNHMTTIDQHDIMPAPASIVLTGNYIDAISANAFDLYAFGQTIPHGGAVVELSQNELFSVHGLFSTLNGTVDFVLANNHLALINQADISPMAWDNTEYPIDFANNPWQCDQPDIYWFACWAQHFVGGMDTGEDRLKFLVCADEKHAGKSLHDLVVAELNDNGVCHKFFPDDNQFHPV